MKAEEKIVGENNNSSTDFAHARSPFVRNLVVVEVVVVIKNDVTRVCLRVDEESVCWITKKQTQQNQKRVHLRIDVIESKINCQLIER